MDLITRLLNKNGNERLGNGPLDGEEIMNHPFFSGIEWDKLLRREISPPFVPDSRMMNNLMYFPKEFTLMPINSEDNIK